MFNCKDIHVIEEYLLLFKSMLLLRALNSILFCSYLDLIQSNGEMFLDVPCLIITITIYLDLSLQAPMSNFYLWGHSHYPVSTFAQKFFWMKKYFFLSRKWFVEVFSYKIRHQPTTTQQSLDLANLF